MAVIAAETWSWKRVRAWVEQRYRKHVSPRSCLRYLHRLGFVWKRPNRLLLQASAVKRAAFVAAHRGPALREDLQTPDLQLELIALPAYRPDCNPTEALWKWLRDEVTANTCFGTAADVAAAVWEFLLGLNTRQDEVQQRCQNELQTAAFPERSRHPERRVQRLEQRRQRALQAALTM